MKVKLILLNNKQKFKNNYQGFVKFNNIMGSWSVQFSDVPTDTQKEFECSLNTLVPVAIGNVDSFKLYNGLAIMAEGKFIK